MQLPGNSSVPTSHQFKHRELESIKEEIKKLLPTFSLHTHSLKKIENAKAEKIKERQTVTNFNLFKPELNRLNTAAVFHQENKGEKFQRDMMRKREEAINRLSWREESEEDQSDHMAEWRQEMMRHLHPHRLIHNSNNN